RFRVQLDGSLGGRLDYCFSCKRHRQRNCLLHRRAQPRVGPAGSDRSGRAHHQCGAGSIEPARNAMTRDGSRYSLRMRVRFLTWFVGAVLSLPAQIPTTPARQRLMRPLVRGNHAAVSSMKPEATLAAQRILDAGGNAFDAAVAGQAVLALVDAENNGV